MFNYTVFSTENKKYLFDGISCNIFQVSDVFFSNSERIIDDVCTNSTPMFPKEHSEVLEAIEFEALLPVDSDATLEYWFDEQSVDFVRNAKQLMIGLTEDCNMRCRYCCYGGHYPDNRTHSSSTISTETLRRTVDFYITNSLVERKVISFYGGEPLKEFNKIREIVDSIDNVNFYITTNGLLLNDEIQKWFVKNPNIHIFVSFAGLKDWHDSLRVSSNGSHTFDLIRENLSSLRSLDPEAFSARVHLIFNVFSESQLPELNKFWQEDELFFSTADIPEITFIDMVDDDGYVKKLKETIISQDNNDTLNMYIDFLKHGNYNNLIVKYYDSKFLNIHKRTMNERAPYLSSVCKPFESKLYVDVNGELSLCENFNANGAFGNINETLNKDALYNLINEYKEARADTCSSCWALRLCSQCFKDLPTNRDLSKINNICTNEKEYILNSLKEYCYILEEDENLLQHLDNYNFY